MAPAPERPRPPAWLADTSLRMLFVAALLFACVRIAEPFIVVLIWSVLLAVMFRPLHLRLQALGLRNWVAATLLGAAGVLLLIAPAVAIVDSIAASAVQLVKTHQSDALALPELPMLAKLPVVGDAMAREWADVRANTPETLGRHAATVEGVVLWLGARASSLASGFVRFLAAIAIGAVLLAYGDGLGRTANALICRLAGDPDRGERMIALSIATVQSVVKGVIGMAVIQAVLLGSAFFVFHVPFAGLIVMVLLVVGIVQIPSQLLSVPAALWLWSVGETRSAIVFVAWIIAVAVIDAALKPLMLGRGLAVPVPIILIGVIGGALAAGLLGLFVGPVLLALGYMLLLEWLGEPVTTDVGRQPAKP